VNALELWQRYRQYLHVAPSVGLTLDISRMLFPPSFFEEMSQPMAQALQAVTNWNAEVWPTWTSSAGWGHYWLRAPATRPGGGHPHGCGADNPRDWQLR